MKYTLQISGILNLLGFITIAQTAFAQPLPIRFQHLSVEQGLSNNNVYAITQDKYGLIWIATEDGLNRFDGYEVIVYKSKHGDKNSLPSNEVLSLFTDSRGMVWIGTGNGLAYYDDHTNSFRSFFKNPADKNSLPGNVINVINENCGLLWIGTTQGICSFDVRNNHFQRFLHSDHSNSISDNVIRDIKFAPNGTMWITTNNGLNRLDLSTMRFTSFFHDPADNGTLSDNRFGKMSIDKNGNLWTFLWNSSYLEFFNTKTNCFKHFLKYHEKQSRIPSSRLLSLFIDRSERTWLGNNSAGLSHFLPDGEFFYEYKADPLDQNKIQSNTIRGMYQDRSGLIWLATNAGAERFNPDESKFILYDLQSISPLTLADKNVRAITEDSAYRLWIGTSNGIFILNRNTGTFTNYQWNRNDPNSLRTNSILSLCCDRHRNIWVSTPEGLDMFEPVHKKFRSFYYLKNNNAPFSDNYITSIVCDKNEDLLIGSRGGLSIYHFSTHRFSNFKNDSAHPLLNDQINVLFEDDRGRLWMGMRNSGLIKYNRRSGDLENFTKVTGDTTSIPANYVCSITQDREGIIWVGTSSGLCRFNENTRTFTIFSEKSGLPNERVTQLLVDDCDRIWMGTNRGISMLNESRTAFTNYDPSDGLQGWEFSEPSAFKTHDGYFCYGGSYGFNMFHPDSIKKNLFKPPLILKKIRIFDQPLNTDCSYLFLKELKLSYKQNFFSFEFAALSYDHPEKNQYACQLIGFEKKIVKLGTNHSISYTNVPHGHYTLKVIASNNDDVWNESGYELKLNITPPFWVTWWFRTILITAFLGAVFAYFKLRENRIKKDQVRQTAINKQIAEIRMSALRAQMNPHFIFNSLSSIQHFITTREKEEALNYLSKFSKLIRKILENSRENSVSISSELQLLELYIQLEQLRFSNKFDYSIAVDEKIDIENTEIPPLLIQPYVENAIQHGLINKNGKGNLWLSLEKNNGLLICKIEDNGIGRARAQEIEEKKHSRHKSLGIKVTDERISTLSAMLDYKMEVVIEDLFKIEEISPETMEAAGTRVTISIQVKEEE